MDHHCILNPDHEGTPWSIGLRVPWDPDFVGLGFKNIYMVVEQLAADELKTHRDYTGEFDLCPLPISEGVEVTFPFMVFIPHEEEDQ